MATPQEREISEEDNGEIDSDDISLSGDSEEDPTFDIVEETRSRIAKISIKQSRPRKVKEMDSEIEVGEVAFGVEILELDEKDGICFDKVEKLIEDGHLEKLKVDQCKVYLRKYGLRLTGKKNILLERIKEHLEVINGGGERKYPLSSFVLNCKGDACTGDVVMFEQKVYDMFSIASRSATGPSIGTRIIVGRIVKESYGAAKQQHTFTIEVLWSKGEKALPPLHPLLIKGRNLYRLQTVRQRWTNEEERKKVLREKHQRGSTARCSREIRIEKKETRKTGIRIVENKGKQQHANPIQTKIAQPERVQLQHLQKDSKFQPGSIQNPPRPPLHDLVNTAQVSKARSYGLQNPPRPQLHDLVDTAQVSMARSYGFQNPPRPQLHDLVDTAQVSKARSYGFQNPPRPQLHVNHQQYPPIPHWSIPHNQQGPPRQQEHGQPRQLCRFYRQGRCYYGDRCKYLHD